MMEIRRYHAPTREHELLLKAALLDGPAAVAAWKEWSASVDLDHLGDDSYCLLPLMAGALERRGIADPGMGRLKGVYRRTWYDNTLRFHSAAAVLRALHDAGIETMLLKGAALTLRYYRDAGLRPMDDFDILVPTRQGPRALDVLKGLAWTPNAEVACKTEVEALAIGHAYPFLNARDQAIDLHWHVFYQRVHLAADSGLWAAANPIVLSGVPTLTLTPADQLLHVCVHGTERLGWSRDREPNLRWVPDAMMILRNAGEELDWDRLLAQARRLQFVLPMREALSFLHDVLAAPIPAAALARLQAMRVPLGERIAERARSRPHERWGPWVALGVRYLEYCSTLPPDVGVLRRLAGLPAFFGRRWGDATPWHLPFVAIFRVLRRIRWAVESHRHRRTDIAPSTRA